jgi:uncharacterized protein YejL (UPF0352 family)
MKARLINETINSHWSDQRFVQQWIDDLIELLKKHKVTQFGGSIPLENIEVGFLSEGAADITCSVNTGKVRFNIFISLRDDRRVKDTESKWLGEVSISSPSRPGSFGKKVSGKNTSPSNLIKVLSDIFDLKYGRR